MYAKLTLLPVGQHLKCTTIQNVLINWCKFSTLLLFRCFYLKMQNDAKVRVLHSPFDTIVKIFAMFCYRFRWLCLVPLKHNFNGNFSSSSTLSHPELSMPLIVTQQCVTWQSIFCSVNELKLKKKRWNEIKCALMHCMFVHNFTIYRAK